MMMIFIIVAAVDALSGMLLCHNNQPNDPSCAANAGLGWCTLARDMRSNQYKMVIRTIGTW